MRTAVPIIFVVRKTSGFFDGAVNVTLCSEVYNHIRVFFLKKFVNCLAVGDAFFYETEIWVVHDRRKSGKVSCIGQTVQTDDAVIRVFFNM